MMVDERIKEIVKNPHLIYRRYKNYWDFLVQSYEGGIDYTGAALNNQDSTSAIITVNGSILDTNSIRSYNLFKHPKELSESYRKRVESSYYYNFCQPIIDIYTENMFKQPIVEDFGDITDILDLTQDNIDRMGSSVREFRVNLCEMVQIYGHCFVIVDMPVSQGEVNLEQRIVNNQFPYFTIIQPGDVINWALDNFGEPYWVMVVENSALNIDPFNFDKDNLSTISYKLWTRTSWHKYNSELELVDEGVNPIGKVPIVCFYDRKSKKYAGFLGISSLSDIAFINRNIYNLCSELQQIIDDQTFSFLALQGDISEYQGDKSIGTSKGLIYPEGKNPPTYVAPPNGPAEIVITQINNQVRKIYQIAKVDGGSASLDQQVKTQSGISQAFDFQETNSSLSKKANNLNDGEMKLWQLYASWENKVFDGSIQYPNEFSIRSVNDDIEEAVNFGKLEIGNMVKKELNKHIIKKKFPMMPDEELDLLINDMESAVGQDDVSKVIDRIRNRQSRETVPNGEN